MTDAAMQPFRVAPKFVERVWGRRELAPWYEQQFDAAVGEAWLTGDACVVATGPQAGESLAAVVGESFPLLVKMLFPQEKLSVQVHPNDADAAAAGGDVRAKTECWYVLEASPDATVALGLRKGTTEADVDSAMGQPVFEDLLEIVPVAVRDMLYVDAGTVHAIGGGSVLLEVQQNSDTTYRLYDYGRPRELHLEAGRKVIRLATDAGKKAAQEMDGVSRLIDVPHFVVDRIDVAVGEARLLVGGGGLEAVVAIAGGGAVVSAKNRVELRVGEAVVVPRGCAAYEVEGPCSVLRCRVPKGAERA